jgi:hypothetical protein
VASGPVGVGGDAAMVRSRNTSHLAASGSEGTTSNLGHQLSRPRIVASVTSPRRLQRAAEKAFSMLYSAGLSADAAASV